MNSTIRVFFAINFNEKIREQLREVSNELKKHYHEPIKWIKPSDYHLTLQFIEKFNPEQLEAIIQSFQAIRLTAPFTLITGKLIGLPIENPHIIAVSVTLTDELATLVRSLNNILNIHGYPPDKRPFSPHVTLARIKRQKKPLSIEPIDISATQLVSSITLFQSQLTPEGSEYAVLHDFGFYSD